MTLHQTELSLYYPDLPEGLDGFMILHLSDLHFRRFGVLEQRISEVIRRGCDLLLCSGDICYQLRIGNPFHSSSQAEDDRKIGLGYHGLIFPPKTDKAVNFFTQLVHDAPAKLGCFTVQGNHDPDDMLSRLNPNDVTILNNQAVELHTTNGDVLGLCGLKCGRRDQIDVISAVSQLKPDCFSIGLTHYPDTAEALAAAGMNLILAGHTHGGQICLPGRRPILTHSRTGKKYVAGLYRIQNNFLYTSRGVNTTLLPIRICCPPEVVRITLRSGSNKNNSITITEL